MHHSPLSASSRCTTNHHASQQQISDQTQANFNQNDQQQSNQDTIARNLEHQRLKDIGWYWGSISPEYSEKILENEEEGSFLVRDSSTLR